MLLHLDGEFATVEDLVIETLTGRNLGWLPTETSTAVKHIARVIREDEGANPRLLKQSYGAGIPYRALFLGTDDSLPPGAVIPWQYRIDVMKASDEQVLMAVARMIHAYIDALRFGSKNTNHKADSPYDLFLAKNDLPVWSGRARPTSNTRRPCCKRSSSKRASPGSSRGRTGSSSCTGRPSSSARRSSKGSRSS
jgi:hypothetical protein